MPTFEEELSCLINRYSKENESNTPDFILALYIRKCLEAYAEAVKARDRWYSFDPWPSHSGGTAPVAPLSEEGAKDG